MKGRESGMPEKSAWENFFNARGIVDSFISEKDTLEDMCEFGCGYGTFTTEIARLTSGTIYSFDIENSMVEATKKACNKSGVTNVNIAQRDLCDEGTGLKSFSQSNVFIFNLLHIENPFGLLSEAYRILKQTGSISIIHWRTDIPTPRGPSIAIRPTPANIRKWLQKSGFKNANDININKFSQWHFAISAVKE